MRLGTKPADFNVTLIRGTLNCQVRRISQVLLFILTLSFCLFCFAGMSCSKNGTGGVDNDEPEDNTAPGIVSDLAVDAVTTTSVTFSWTAPGDDEFEGIVAAYDFRGSLDSITPANFDQAYEVDSIVLPIPAGLHQVGTLRELTSGTTYYFALKAVDDQGNWSGLSNCVRADCPEDVMVEFPDASLEAAVRSHINKPSGDIHASDLDTVREFYANSAGIADLTGMEYMTALTMLHLYDNDIEDLTPLSGLTELGGLHIGTNPITDISPLSGLTRLVQLSIGQSPLADISPIVNLTSLIILRLDQCNVTDFTPLQSLPNLEELNVASNPLGSISFISGMSKLKSLQLSATQISDLAPLSSQTDLEYLYLTFNNIVDISTLSGLTALTFIDLRWNSIIDISPLVSNTGLGAGDEVKLENNPLSETSIDIHIPALEENEVTVTY